MLMYYIEIQPSCQTYFTTFYKIFFVFYRKSFFCGTAVVISAAMTVQAKAQKAHARKKSKEKGKTPKKRRFSHLHCALVCYNRNVLSRAIFYFRVRADEILSGYNPRAYEKRRKKPSYR